MNSKRITNVGYGLLLLGLVAAPFVGAYPVFVMKLMCFALFACAFNLLLGYTGLLSFGHAAFFGGAAYVAGHAMKVWGLTPEVGLLLGTFGGALLGLIFGWLAIRRQGIYFSMITFAIGELAHFMQNSVLSRWTGGDNGLPGVPYPRFKLGERLVEIAPGWGMYVMLALIFVATFWFARRLVHSPFGHVLNAMRINPDRTLAVGHHLQRYKMAALVVSAAYSGLAGAMLGVFQSYIGPDAVSLETSSQVVMQTVIGGVRMTSRTLKTLIPKVSRRPVRGSVPRVNSRISSLLVPARRVRASIFLRSSDITHSPSQTTCHPDGADPDMETISAGAEQS